MLMMGHGHVWTELAALQETLTTSPYIASVIW